MYHIQNVPHYPLPAKFIRYVNCNVCSTQDSGTWMFQFFRVHATKFPMIVYHSQHLIWLNSSKGFLCMVDMCRFNQVFENLEIKTNLRYSRQTIDNWPRYIHVNSKTKGVHKDIIIFILFCILLCRTFSNIFTPWTLHVYTNKVVNLLYPETESILLPIYALTFKN